MRPRIVGRIILGVAAVVFVLWAIVLAIEVNREAWHHGLEAITCAILALTSVVAYRYFED